VACDQIFIESLKMALAGQSKETIFFRALTYAREASPVIFEYLKTIPETPWKNLKTSGFCVETLGAAYWALLNQENFENALIAVANRGDDSDSCAAVTGALCGAVYGVEAIPARWLEKLEFRTEIFGQVQRLLPIMAS
jgi:ADP-ribosyl-[dinitrogen reductase] hydrolase